jgi:phosphate starvation-inducible PhoH-like protein
MARRKIRFRKSKKQNYNERPKMREVQQRTTNGRLNLIKPKTINQKSYVDSINEYDITICSGPSGTGKSLVALSTALRYFFDPEKPQKKIFVTRPMIATAQREFPFIKGTLYEKLVPYFAPILSNLEDLLGSKQDLIKMIENETIVLQAIELARGTTFKNCSLIITESQNMTIAQSVMAITRLGENCKMIIEGDTDQKDLRGPDGLTYLINKLHKRNDLCGMVHMGVEDILRHPLIGQILEELDYKGLAGHD